MSDPTKSNVTPLTHRIDQSHEQPEPHLLKKSDQLLVRMMCRKLEQQETSARDVGRQLLMFDQMSDDLLNLVNQTLPDERKRIRDPAHAAVMVGETRLRRFLSNYVEADELDAYANLP